MSPLFKASQDIAVSGFECGTEFELRVVVTFTYHRAEKGDEIDPPTPAFVEGVRCEFYELTAGGTLADGINMPAKLVERFTGSDSFTDWLITDAESQMEDAKAGMGL